MLSVFHQLKVSWLMALAISETVVQWSKLGIVLDCFNTREIAFNLQSNISEVKWLSQYRYYIPKENAGVAKRRIKNPCKTSFNFICYHLKYFFLKYISQTTKFVKWWLACFLNIFKIKASFNLSTYFLHICCFLYYVIVQTW